MKKYTVFTFLLLAAVCQATAQKKLGVKPHREEWEEKPVIHQVPNEFQKEYGYYIINDQSFDYRHEGSSTNIYYTRHELIKVLDDRGIEEFNTINIPVGSGTRVPLIKARTILPNGKVNDIAQDMILVTLDGSGHYKVVIAMEGVEKNAEIELLVKMIYPASYFRNLTFQCPLPIVSSNLEFSYPKDLAFEERGFNGYPTVKDTLLNNRMHINIMKNDIPALRREPLSFYDLNCMRAEIRIKDFREDQDKTRELNWDSLAKEMFIGYYDINDKERKSVNKFLEELGVRPYGNEAENIRKIENGIKNTIVRYAYVDYDQRKKVLATNTFRSISVYDPAYGEQKEILDTIISKKSATVYGYIKLFVACFIQAGVRHEIGMVGNRQDYIFDKEFPNLEQMEYLMFYFPGQKKYLSPNDLYYRYPFIPEGATGSQGVFCVMPPDKRKGDYARSFYETRTIPQIPASDNLYSASANVNFTKDMDAQVEIAYDYSGYRSAEMRTEMAVLSKDRLKKYIESQIGIAERPDEIVSYTVSNEGFDNYNTNKPLEIYAAVNTSRLTEMAGPDYIFKIGKVIGWHTQLYNEEKRKMPVDLVSPTSSHHTITINIPPGYKVLNPEVLKIQAEYVDRELSPLVSFKSDYTIISDKKKGDKLVVTTSESCNQLHFPLNEYERFRQVWNAAADFNKVSILIGKEKSKRSRNVKTASASRHH